jgi:tripartite-type tricarboxylate transporter receptor subunit TctC
MKRLSSVTLLFVFAMSVVAQAQTYPTRPLKIIVPYAAGGTADTLARKIAQHLTGYLGQPVIIDNRAGAAGLIGAAVLQQSVPDGYTVGMLATPHVATPADVGTNFDPTKLTAVSLVAVVPSLVCANPSVPAQSVAEVIALARSKPGQLTYGNPGTYSAGHLAMELFKQRANVDIRAVPYRGGAPAFQDLLGGQISLAISGPSNCLPFIQTGQLRPIATTGSTRSSAAPDVPTFAESGLPGFELNEWWGVLAPLNTPKDIVARLNKEINRAVQEAEVRDFFMKIGAEPQNISDEEFGKFFANETRTLKALVGSLGLKPDTSAR